MKSEKVKVMPLICGFLGLIGLTSLVVYLDNDLTFNQLFFPALSVFLMFEIIRDRARLSKVSQSVDDVALSSHVETSILFEEINKSHDRIDKWMDEFNRKLDSEVLYINTISEIKDIGKSLKISNVLDEVIELESAVKLLKIDVDSINKRLDKDKAAR
jgi:hypothetical protein